MANKNFISKIHLVISVLVVAPVAFIYGFNPSSKFDIHPETIDEINQFKAIMGLYLGFALIWVLGVFKKKYLKVALVTNTVFMLSLGVGRITSWFIDGTPTFEYRFGVFAELFLGFYGLWVLITQYQGTTNS
ncbi:DUF4345 domain-containing protein [uncultured Winogradskyella sp.]|uniref:DUF4345 domain-containing protein n=1 Tax=uncultured Winogradskyella sp. TaxID=395353 RepID=UPI002618C206|nr:DUF4345 domain-containing protein [uncultured Winogradskyella sp.]